MRLHYRSQQISTAYSGFSSPLHQAEERVLHKLLGCLNKKFVELQILECMTIKVEPIYSGHQWKQHYIGLF